jgi:DNA-binding IclR family transcriptional regulator
MQDLSPAQVALSDRLTRYEIEHEERLAADGRQRARSQDVILTILECVATSPEPLTAAGIARHTGVRRASVYRNLDWLEDGGWVVRDEPSRRYRPSFRLASLGLHALERQQYRDGLLVHAAGLCRDLRSAVWLNFYEAGDVIIADALHWIDDLVVPSCKTLRLPAPVIAAGMALLAFQTDDEVERVAHAAIPSLTPDVPMATEEILAEVELTRGRGYVLRGSEGALAITAVAIPVFNGDGQVVAAFGWVAHDPAALSDGLDVSRRAAERASAQLGYRPPAAFA